VPEATAARKIPVDSRDNANIHGDRAAASDTFELAFLKYAQQRNLGFRGSSPTSSRKSVPPSASSKRPKRRWRAPVKAPFSWPKSSDTIKKGECGAVLH